MCCGISFQNSGHLICLTKRAPVWKRPKLLVFKMPQDSLLISLQEIVPEKYLEKAKETKSYLREELVWPQVCFTTDTESTELITRVLFKRSYILLINLNTCLTHPFIIKNPLYESCETTNHHRNTENQLLINKQATPLFSISKPTAGGKAGAC